MTFLVGASTYVSADMSGLCFEAGYRRDNEEWKNRTNDYGPSITNKITFEDIDIFQIGVKGATTLGCNLYARAGAYWGWVLDGDFKEKAKVYGESATVGDFSVANGFVFSADSNSVVDERHVYGIDAAIGYPFYFCDCTLEAAPIVGYSYDQQDLWIETEGLGIDSNGLPGSGIGCCCNRKYLFSWYGPFVGADFKWRPCNECWSLYAGFEYHFASFHGRRHHSDFDDFDHNRRHFHNAHGWVVNLGAEYDLCECWTVGFCVKIRDYYARKHHRRHSYSSSEESGRGFAVGSGRGRRTNEWDSYAINLTIGRQF